jgi:3'(2'), 5'-bisphosphate nucleotidase
MDFQNHFIQAIGAALEAGEKILAVYRTDFTVSYKSDSSPLTVADQASHRIIKQRLDGFGLPLLSEEGRHLPYADRQAWNRFWIVDPLDGTKEFVKKNGEFTVNIARVEKETPLLGVVFAPDRQLLYFALSGSGSFRIDDAATIQKVLRKIHDASLSMDFIVDVSLKLPAKRPEAAPYTIVGSRSHATPDLEAFVAAKRRQHGRINFVPAGSSLKICLVAEGTADIYPRLGPTMEWDTAAGQAVANFAGADLVSYETGEPLVYNKKNLLNPWFIVERKNTP